MAHIHLEDGAFSPFWVLAWSLAAAGVISLALLSLGKGKVSPRKLAIAAMCTAVGFAVFQVSIPIFGGIHLNLTPMIGILAGPGLGSLSVLIINIFSAAVGHGGWGMIGANTLVNVTEVLVAYYVYRMMRRSMNVDRFLSGLTSGVAALTLSAILIVGIVVLSGVQDSASTAEETAGNMLLIGVANIVAGVIEGLITGYVAAFIGRTRPDLLADAEGAAAKGTEG